MLNEYITRSLRAMAWERAKGELRSIYHTFFSDDVFNQPDQYDNFVKLTEDFIEQIESNGLNE